MITEEIKSRMNVFMKDKELIETKFKKDPQTIVKEFNKIKDKRIHLILFFFDGHHTKD